MGSSSHAGSGPSLRMPFPSRAGEVITMPECHRRMREAKQAGEPHFYMMELAPGLIIDARARGNLARLINSSCAPNCESQKWHDPTGGHAFGACATLILWSNLSDAVHPSTTA